MVTTYGQTIITPGDPGGSKVFGLAWRGPTSAATNVVFCLWLRSGANNAKFDHKSSQSCASLKVQVRSDFHLCAPKKESCHLAPRGLRVPLRAVVSFASASTRFVIDETFICAILLVWEVGSDGKFLTRLLFAGGIAGAVRDPGHLAHVPLERWALSSIPPLLESASVLGD